MTLAFAFDWYLEGGGGGGPETRSCVRNGPPLLVSPGSLVKPAQ